VSVDTAGRPPDPPPPPPPPDEVDEPVRPDVWEPTPAATSESATPGDGQDEPAGLDPSRRGDFDKEPKVMAPSDVRPDPVQPLDGLGDAGPMQPLATQESADPDVDRTPTAEPDETVHTGEPGQLTADPPVTQLPVGEHGPQSTDASAGGSDDNETTSHTPTADSQGADAAGPSDARDEPDARRGWQEGDPVPPPLEGDRLPLKDINEFYRGEEDPNNSDRAFAPDTVKYMSPEQREECRLFVDGDGRLRQAKDGELFDTTEASTLHSDGRAIFVMDCSGNLYATTDHAFGITHHSSLLAGDPVAGAGEITVRNGDMSEMTDASGHYEPTAEMNDRALEVLRDQGLRTSPDFKQYDYDGKER
jgi:hypothetical protein